MNIEDIKSLPLHKKILIHKNTYLMRVPNGYMYYVTSSGTNFSCFVPEDIIQEGIHPTDKKHKYSKETIILLASKSKTLKEVGDKLGVSKERARQLVNLFEIKKEVRHLFEKNRLGHGLEPLPKEPGVFSIYFEGDPDKREYYLFSKDMNKRFQGLITFLKSKRVRDKLKKHLKKYGLDNLRANIYFKCDEKKNS